MSVVAVAATLPVAPRESAASAGRVLLHGVRWEVYEGLVADHRDRSAPRFAYDRGTLEIMAPSPEHEERKGAATQIVETAVAALDLDLRNFGSVTLRRADLSRGFEPDACFYIQNAGRLLGRTLIDLDAGDPPPDLVIEIDFTSPSLPKLPLYAALGVAEVWRILGDGTVEVLALGEEGTYIPRERSVALPSFTADDLRDLLARRASLRPAAWQTLVREYAARPVPGT